MFFQIDVGNGLAIYDRCPQIKFAVAGGLLKEAN